jgi:flagellar hook assembly protein FlgD
VIPTAVSGPSVFKSSSKYSLTVVRSGNGCVISFALAQGSMTENIGIYNAAGTLVKNFSGNQMPASGKIVWNGTDNNGRKLSKGLYFIRLRAGSRSVCTKLVLPSSSK